MHPGCARCPDNKAFFDDLRGLIEVWCERRCLQSLSLVLTAYNSFNSMTDSWGELLKALKALALVREALPPSEPATIGDIRQAAEDAIRVR
jgi:hypothetical protein